MERVADYVIRKVNEYGVNDIFMVNGRGILYLTDAVAKNEKIKHISTYHEQSASYAAMAYAKATDSLAACLVSTGCAATNSITAALCAYQDNLPVVFISGNNHLKENTRNTGLNIRTYGSQEADIISIVKPITKYAVMLDDINNVVYEVEKAIEISLEGRRGPVWIDIPLDVQNMRLDETCQKHFIKNEVSYSIDEDIKQVAEEINRAKRPCILVGGGARKSEEYIGNLSKKYRIPVVCSPAGVDNYGTYNEYNMGCVGSIGGTRSGNFVVQNCDFLLVLGSKLCSQLTGEKKNFARKAKIVAINIDKVEHKKDNLINLVVISSVEHFLKSLLKENLSIHEVNWINKCLHWKEVFSVEKEAFVEEAKKANQNELYGMLYEFNKYLPDEASVITDAGLEELTVPSVIKFKNGQKCLFPAAQGAMGYALPAIIGAYAAGRKNIICIVGDGSVMMNIQELQIISAMKIPAKIFVINNNMYAIIRKRQRDLFRKRTIGNDPTDGLPMPNFMKIAESYDIKYRCIHNYDELKNEISTCFDNKLEIIEIYCAEDQKYLHESYAINEKKRLVHRPIEDMAPFLSRELIKSEMIVDLMEE